MKATLIALIENEKKPHSKAITTTPLPIFCTKNELIHGLIANFLHENANNTKEGEEQLLQRGLMQA
jgi:hypothetical protein